MKKRYLAIIPLLFTLCACGEGSNTESQATSKPSQSISATVDNSNDNMTDPLYKVTVLLPNGEKYNKSGAQAQWCATTCFTPVPIVNGVASDNFEDANMEVHILNLDPKYTYNVNINPTNKDNREITIQLMDLKNPTSGDGSDTNPFVVSLGAYRSSHTSVGSSGVVNYSFTPTEAGTYVFESMAQVGNLAVNKMDPVFYYDSQVKAGGIGTNFKKELVCEANVTYNFKLFLSDASGLKTTASETNPAKFDFTILKK